MASRRSSGDVAGSLPIALRKRLIGCRVVMPLYDSIKQEYKDKMKFITSISRSCKLAPSILRDF